jgi:hypothetical protein
MSKKEKSIEIYVVKLGYTTRGIDWKDSLLQEIENLQKSLDVSVFGYRNVVGTPGVISTRRFNIVPIKDLDGIKTEMVYPEFTYEYWQDHKETINEWQSIR